MADFDHLVTAAREHSIDIAMDVAFQCSPDHPYVKEHPEWFRHRPDGTIKYAENPPKKYQDIYPLDFECADWQGLWNELLSVVLFWAEHGIRIFRVDNPHTKPFRFWEWLIAKVRESHPDSVFLSEAFTRPKVMRRLAKMGFSQSYSYFTWRNTGPEIAAYFKELTQTSVRKSCAPTCSPIRRTSCPSSYGIRASTPSVLGSCWPRRWGRPTAFTARRSRIANPGRPARARNISTRKSIRFVNGTGSGPTSSASSSRASTRFAGRIPRSHYDHRLRFHPTDNENLLFYSKTTADLSSIILVVVNVDPHHPQSGWVHVPLAELELEPDTSFQVHDLLTDGRFLWHGEANFVTLDPGICPAAHSASSQRAKTERDFDYFI